jgi:probable rRNA maturation factor
MSVLITNNQSRFNVSQDSLRKTAETILNALGCENVELSILIVDDRKMAEYHRDYLNREGPTNVIAFPMQEGEFAHVSPHLMGDVVISLDTASREAGEMGIDMAERFDELLIHGILHLAGYDHEKSEAEERRMEKKSEALASLLREMEK